MRKRAVYCTVKVTGGFEPGGKLRTVGSPKMTHMDPPVEDRFPRSCGKVLAHGAGWVRMDLTHNPAGGLTRAFYRLRVRLY